MKKLFHMLGVAVGVALLAGTTVSAEQPLPRYTGEPISLNLKNVDLHDFFRLIHEISGLNIVVDAGVRGTVTLVLLDVPWDQALDLVLKSHRLVSELDGNVLRIMTHETAKREQEAKRELAAAAAAAVPLRTVVCTLSYAKARELAPVLRRLLSARGEIAVDERTNTLIVTDVPEVLRTLTGDYRQCR